MRRRDLYCLAYVPPPRRDRSIIGLRKPATTSGWESLVTGSHPVSLLVQPPCLCGLSFHLQMIIHPFYTLDLARQLCGTSFLVR